MKKYLITSALPYINGVKHLGNLIGSMLPADVSARFLRLKGHEVLYICATDEHGTPAEIAALDAGLPVDEYCRQQHDVQENLGRRFHLSYDHFGRSSSAQNKNITTHFFKKLDENGYIEEKTIAQVFCVDDDRFLPDRYITGTCPHCGYESARGDQCESCTRVLDPTDLINPRSSISGSANLEVRETRHLFLRQSQLEAQLREWLSAQSHWPSLTLSIARKWLDEGLKDRCITRDLKWGVPVDKPGFEDKVFYVWFDAPMEYIGSTWEWADLKPGERDWRSWWFNAENTEYIQFMAKDNVPFHTIIWPSSLIGSGEPVTLPTYIKGFNWLTYYGGKFSTSQHRGIFMSDAIELLPADYWRYYLLSNAPESSDADFTWENFGATVNKDLADVLGNFVNRIMKFAHSRFGGVIPEGGGFSSVEQELFENLGNLLRSYENALYEMSYRKAMQHLRAIWVLGNNYLASAAPWSAIKTDPERAACITRTGLNLVRFFAVISQPVLVETTAKICSALSLKQEELSWPDSAAGLADELQLLAPGHAFAVPDLLFRKLEDDELKKWEAQFSGEQE
jgi:methionyl-tRNA synthetase